MLYSRIEGEGKPLLIIHGFLGMSDNWKTLGTQYASEGFQVHAIDMRNHGKSFHANEFNYSVMVQDLLEYCQEHNLNSTSIIGHSMGGKVAMFFAVKYPNKIDKLIIADIGPKYYPQHHQTILAGLNAVDFSKKPSRAEIDAILQSYVSDYGTRQFLLKNVYRKTPEQLAFRFNLKAFNSTIEEVGTSLPESVIFEKPTLFIRGGNSNYILDEDFQQIRTMFINCQFTTIPNVGHWLHAENPKLFFEETTRFLK
jgi:pimeloyl-ACP methyl ester carboxylesterase